jgi:hypothetical protein
VSPASTACEYGPIGAGASGVKMIVLDIGFLFEKQDTRAKMQETRAEKQD